MNIDKISEKKDNNEIILKLLRLIFLNISPLHHYPYSLLLYYLGKELLFKLTK